MWCFIRLKNLFQWLIPLAKDAQPAQPDPQPLVSQLSSIKSKVHSRHLLLLTAGVRVWADASLSWRRRCWVRLCMQKAPRAACR